MELINRKLKRSFHFLNITQFLGALNDNIFKLLIVFLLINIQGEKEASIISATAGAVFVIPFLIFSAAAGILADKLSKRNIVVSMKLAEIIIMALSIIAIYMQSAMWCYLLLFFMSLQSTIFSPSKYGIIPEIVEAHKVSKANGMLTASTFLAIILGTFLASFLTDITDKNFILSGFICVAIAILGYITSIKIEKTVPMRSKKKFNPLFFYEVYKTLALSAKRPHLFWAIFGSAFFMFIGAFVQINIIPFALDSLKLNETGGGYLFLATAIGISLGSITAGRILKDKVDLGLACVVGYSIPLLFICLWIFSKFLIITIILLVLLGFFGGMFVIPFDTFIQVRSPDSKRGQVIATANFLSYMGVLLASGFVSLINKTGFSSASCFALMGIFSFIIILFITSKLPELFFSFLARKILIKFYSIKIDEIPSSTSLLIIKKTKLKNLLLLYAMFFSLKFIIATEKPSLWKKIFKTFYLLSKEDSFEDTFHDATKQMPKETALCLVLKEPPEASLLENIQDQFSNIYYLSIKKETVRKKSFGYWFNQKQIHFSFDKR